MIEIILAILVIGCIIYIFKGDFFRRNAGVTVLKSLPLSIFKKWVKEDENIKQEATVKVNHIKTSDDKKNNDSASKVLDKQNEDTKAIDKLGKIEEVNEIEAIENIDELSNHSENISDGLINDGKEIIESIEDQLINEDESINEAEQLVYWTPRGKTYHSKTTCRTLVRSKVINSGTVNESGKDFKCEYCK